MLSKFYRRYSVHLLWIVALSFPYFFYKAETLPANNDIETWLPEKSAVRAQYDEFRSTFGAEELILVGLPRESCGERLAEALCLRIEALPGIRQCWSPARMQAVMRDLGVSDREIRKRLEGLTVSADGDLIGLVALLSKAGLEDRAGTVEAVRRELDYCQLTGNEVNLAGAPVVIAELDRLGSRDSNKKFFIVTLLISLGLLYYFLREWKLTLAIVGFTVWAINATLAAIHLAGGEMNFILDALPVMVMIFTLAIAVHFLSYYNASAASPDPLGTALKLAWKPCFLATLTTVIGLVSLTISDISPVSQFGYAAAAGCVIAMFTGLGFTPAALTIWPRDPFEVRHAAGFLSRLGFWFLERSKPVVLTAATLMIASCIGLASLESRIDPLDFLPEDGKVLADVRRIRQDLSNTESVEAVVDFTGRDLAFVEKLQMVRRLQETIAGHPAVQHAMSLASFFPNRLPESPLETARILNRAQSHRDNNDFIAAGEQLWRISARLDPHAGISQQQIFDDLEQMTAGEPVTFTGIAPLLERAQHEIFHGFWESFATAFLIITGVMVVSLRSLKAGLVAMIPNLAPVCLVFGALGWLEIPVDIGMMMTGSIALGIAVDGTFHFLVRYQEHMQVRKDSQWAARLALLQTGMPIMQATVIASIGMLALTLSSFGPTIRFGYLMAAMLLAALAGDLVLLPALLHLRPSQRQSPRVRRRQPHFAARQHAPSRPGLAR